LRFVYLCDRCGKVAGVSGAPGGKATRIVGVNFDIAARECRCPPLAGGIYEATEATVVRPPAPPFVK